MLGKRADSYERADNEMDAVYNIFIVYIDNVILLSVNLENNSFYHPHRSKMHAVNGICK